MGSCESNACFEFLPIQTSIIPGDSYKNCTLNPPLMTLVFTPQLIGLNGSFTVTANGVLIVTMYYQNGNVSSFTQVPGVKPTFDDLSNINLTFTGNVTGLRRGTDYLVGDNYEIRIPQNAFCPGMVNGAFMVFSRPDRLDIAPPITQVPTTPNPTTPAQTTQNITTTPTNNNVNIASLILLIIILFLLLIMFFYMLYK